MDETKDRIKQLEDTIAEEAKTKSKLVEKTKTLEAGICNIYIYIYIYIYETQIQKHICLFIFTEHMNILSYVFNNCLIA